MSGQIQLISIATPANYAKSIADHGWLEACFEPIRVSPATEDESLHVLCEIKQVYTQCTFQDGKRARGRYNLHEMPENVQREKPLREILRLAGSATRL